MVWGVSNLFGRRSPLKPNREVGIRIEEGDEQGAYSVKVNDISPDTLTLAAPTRGNNPIPVKPGTRARIYYTEKEQTYSFESQVKDIQSKPTPVLLLIRPDEESEILPTERNERERFVRAFRVEYRIVPRLARHLGVTRELSEDSVIISTDRPLEINTVVDMNVSLNDGFAATWIMGTVGECHLAEYDKWRRTQRYRVLISYLPGKLSADDRRRIESLGRIT
ncbi:flagellar brake protein [candidate division KSB1 bacterium]